MFCLEEAQPDDESAGIVAVNRTADAKTGRKSKVTRKAIIGLDGSSWSKGGGIYADATSVQRGGIGAECEEKAQMIVAQGRRESHTGANKANTIATAERKEMVVCAKELHATGHLVASDPGGSAEEVAFGVELGAANGIHKLVIEEKIASDIEEGGKSALRLILSTRRACILQKTADDKHGATKNHHKSRSVQEAPPQ